MIVKCGMKNYDWAGKFHKGNYVVSMPIPVMMLTNRCAYLGAVKPQGEECESEGTALKSL